MPFLYVYSPDDFVEGLPDEAGAMAAGSPGFTLTLKPDAEPTIIEVNDNDLVFDEVDSSQTLASTVNIDGTTVSGGTTINSAYDLINTSTGHKVTSFHFGGDGYQQGAVDGIASTVELTPGTSYDFNTERTSHQKNNLYTDFVSCFTTGTRIETASGEIPVEELVPGALIRTADRGVQPLRALLQRKLSAQDLKQAPNLRPVEIRAGALGQGLPRDTLRVSPQHRMLGNSPISRRMFGTGDTLVAARKLTTLPGIEIDEVPRGVTYYHLVLNRHEVVFANGAPTESLFLGPGALRAMTPEARQELQSLFPERFKVAALPDSARFIPSGRLQKQFVARHSKNRKPLLTTPVPPAGPMGLPLG